MKRNFRAAIWLGVLCTAALTAGASPVRAQDRNGRPGDRNDGDRRDGDGWQPQFGDPNAADCNTWEFTSQTPSTKTDKLITESRECRLFPNDQGVMGNYCRSTGKFAARNVTVNIGARTLQPWEKEELQVCLDQFGSASVDVTGMVYDYTVASQDQSHFLGTDSTIFTLTPGTKKPSAASADEITVVSAAAAKLVLADARADYFKGEKITVSIDGMLIPTITPDMPPDQLLKAFVNFKTSQSFDVAPTYAMPMPGATRPGKYVLTITFSRQGPLSTGAASTTATFDVP